MSRKALYAACLMVAIVPLVRADEPATAPATQPTVEAVTQPSTEPATSPATAPTTAPVALSTTAPSTLPSTLPATAPSRPGEAYDHSKPYGLFTSRSLFMKGHVPPPASTITPPPSTQPSGRPEGKIVFIGVTDADGTRVAMFEDTAAGKILQCRVGDALASGKVAEITLDTMTYESGGKPLRVTLGQNLDAGEAPAIAGRAAITDNGNGSPTTGPSAGSAGTTPGVSSTGSGASNDDVLERMKARRRAGQ